jgi:hypothetical protein
VIDCQETVGPNGILGFKENFNESRGSECKNRELSSSTGATCLSGHAFDTRNRGSCPNRRAGRQHGMWLRLIRHLKGAGNGSLHYQAACNSDSYQYWRTERAFRDYQSLGERKPVAPAGNGWTRIGQHDHAGAPELRRGKPGASGANRPKLQIDTAIPLHAARNAHQPPNQPELSPWQPVFHSRPVFVDLLHSLLRGGHPGE